MSLSEPQFSVRPIVLVSSAFPPTCFQANQFPISVILSHWRESRSSISGGFWPPQGLCRKLLTYLELTRPPSGDVGKSTASEKRNSGMMEKWNDGNKRTWENGGNRRIFGLNALHPLFQPFFP